jgi:hypothetical protein
MSIKAWNLIKNSKMFHIRTYRRMEAVLLVSMFANICLGVGIFYTYSIRPEPDYYSTYGETAPVPLVAMDSANDSPNALLADDMTPDSAARVTPLQ